jgi:hypothetical protein
MKNQRVYQALHSITWGATLPQIRAFLKAQGLLEEGLTNHEELRRTRSLIQQYNRRCVRIGDIGNEFVRLRGNPGPSIPPRDLMRRKS